MYNIIYVINVKKGEGEKKQTNKQTKSINLFYTIYILLYINTSLVINFSTDPSFVNEKKARKNKTKQKRRNNKR